MYKSLALINLHYIHPPHKNRQIDVNLYGFYTGKLLTSTRIQTVWKMCIMKINLKWSQIETSDFYSKNPENENPNDKNSEDKNPGKRKHGTKYRLARFYRVSMTPAERKYGILKIRTIKNPWQMHRMQWNKFL